jgi:hypothetical protein
VIAATVAVVEQIPTALLTYGPGGLIALIIGVFSWQQLKIERARGDRERDRADAGRARADDQADRIVALIERVLPALVDSTRATEELLDYSRRDRDRR